MSQHLVNFLKKIEKAVIQDMKDSDQLLFSMKMPPKLVDRKILDEPVSEINELAIDQIPDANKLFFKSKINISCS